MNNSRLALVSVVTVIFAANTSVSIISVGCSRTAFADVPFRGDTNVHGRISITFPGYAVRHLGGRSARA